MDTHPDRTIIVQDLEFALLSYAGGDLTDPLTRGELILVADDELQDIKRQQKISDYVVLLHAYSQYGTDTLIIEISLWFAAGKKCDKVVLLAEAGEVTDITHDVYVDPVSAYNRAMGVI